MKYKGIVKGSRTLDLGVVVGILGMVEMNMPLVREQLGDWYGWIFMGISAAVIVLRKLTTKPLK